MKLIEGGNLIRIRIRHPGNCASYLKWASRFLDWNKVVETAARHLSGASMHG